MDTASRTFPANTNTIDPYISAIELAAMVLRREVSPIELVESCLARIEQLDPGLNAFCYRADNDAKEAASAAVSLLAQASSDQELPPFLGVPLPIKDLVDVEGWPTTHGSAATSRTPATSSDLVVKRFVDAGFILVGKSTTSEFGTVPFTETDVLGITHNPWDTDRTAGGSSSGAGAAVAAGMVPIAHAGDGGGSIRIPASCNGLVGLKPTRGRVASTTVELEGLVTPGVLTRSVLDTAAAVDVLARHDPGSWWSPPTPTVTLSDALAVDPPTRLRVGVLTEVPVASIEVDPACKVAVEVTLRTLESAGCCLVDASLPLPSFDELASAFTTIWNVSGAGTTLTHPDRVQPHNRVLREMAHGTDSWNYADGVARTQRLSRSIVEGFLARYDLVTPTMACLPPKIGAWKAGADREPLMALLNSYPMAIFTTLFNVTGQPAISLPIHHDPATRLPVGVQLVAAPWGEDLLLQVSRILEEAHPWSSRRPPTC